MPRNPTNWDEYQYGTSHRSSISSSTGGRSVHLNGEGEAEVPYGERQEGDDSVLRRRGQVIRDILLVLEADCRLQILDGYAPKFPYASRRRK